MDEQYKVRQFMLEVKELDLPRQPAIPSEDIRLLCDSLMGEELEELCDAMRAKDLVGIADGLADLLYVVYYTANAYGLVMQPIFDEVHRSNMTKKGGAKREDGKQLKSPSYEPPNLEPLIKAQQYRPVAYVDDKPVAWQQPDTGKIVQ